jgi:hypothetical protein
MQNPKGLYILFFSTLIICFIVCFIYPVEALPDENRSLVFPLHGATGEIVQIAIHLNMNFKQRMDPIFYGSGTLFGANLSFSQKGLVASDYELARAIQIFDRNMKVKKIRMAAVPKKTVTFGEGTEIFKLFFKIDAPQSAYFVLNRFHFGNRRFADNIILKQPGIYQLAKIIKNYQKLSHNNLWMTDRRLIVGIK